MHYLPCTLCSRKLLDHSHRDPTAIVHLFDFTPDSPSDLISTIRLSYLMANTKPQALAHFPCIFHVFDLSHACEEGKKTWSLATTFNIVYLRRIRGQPWADKHGISPVFEVQQSSGKVFLSIKEIKFYQRSYLIVNVVGGQLWPLHA